MSESGALSLKENREEGVRAKQDWSQTVFNIKLHWGGGLAQLVERLPQGEEISCLIPGMVFSYLFILICLCWVIAQTL